MVEKKKEVKKKEVKKKLLEKVSAKKMTVKKTRKKKGPEEIEYILNDNKDLLKPYHRMDKLEKLD